MNGLNDSILSVGIDIGTTTTQVVFSRLVIKNTAGFCSMPKIEIVDKTVVYKSRIYFTPLKDDGIDIPAVEKILGVEFKKSGFCQDDIKSGAVIITGESARRQNAHSTVDTLSRTAGDFVVTAAGPELEAVLAGKGAGAKDISEKKSCSVLNLDIGGGTTNACLFDCGKVTGTFALDIGGRVLRLQSDGTVLYVSPKIKPLIKTCRYSIKAGSKAAFSELDGLCAMLAKALLEACGFAPLRKSTRGLFIGRPSFLKRADLITFSGGVAECVYGNKVTNDFLMAAEYGDIGPLLACKIRDAFAPFNEILVKPAETIRATVIGAGNYAMQISGSTIYFDAKMLPIKNLPVVFCSGIENLYEEVSPKLRMLEGQPAALAFSGPKSPSYNYVKMAAEKISDLFCGGDSAIVVLIENDFAKALGQMLHRLNPSRPVLCADGVRASDGDYVDIGFPVKEVLPVVVKTLIFS